MRRHCTAAGVARVESYLGDNHREGSEFFIDDVATGSQNNAVDRFGCVALCLRCHAR